MNGGRNRDASQRRHGPGARTAAAAGLAVSVAVGGLGAAGAQAKSGKLFACYSKKSKVLQHATGRHCAKGSKSISWNKAGVKGPRGSQGAQGAAGPQGPQGAQGPAGAVAGYAGYFSSPASPKSVGSKSSVVVASFTPATAGDYAVHGDATFSTSHNRVGCTDVNATTGSFVPVGLQGDSANISSVFTTDIATNGILHAGPASPIVESCFPFSNGAKLLTAAVTGTQLTTAHLPATAHKLNSAKPFNRFKAEGAGRGAFKSRRGSFKK